VSAGEVVPPAAEARRPGGAIGGDGATWLGRQRITLDACGSTNDEAARLARAGASHGTIVTAAVQHAGRGRLGRVWASPPGGLYLSAVLRLPLRSVDVPPVTLAVGIAVHDTLRALAAPVALKWPNDVVVAADHALAGRKLAGVLVEAQSSGPRIDAIIVGIGLDLDGGLPPELAAQATTLAALTGVTYPPSAVLERLLPHLEHWIDRTVAGGADALTAAWEARMVPAARVRLVGEAGAPVGTALGLDRDGALRVDVGGQVRRVIAGEVVLEPLA
jgi:BirA family biotin operon repressor/biotin-[acetyl-CoA-carboxylase] ligase